MTAPATKIRVDKWLWAARFFKTRSLATHAVTGGRVHVNDERVKPARLVGVGDALTVSKGEIVFEITIVAVSSQRRPAVEAQLLYEESEQSVKNRAEQRELKKIMKLSMMAPQSKPNKRDRRKIRAFTRGNSEK